MNTYYSCMMSQNNRILLICANIKIVKNVSILTHNTSITRVSQWLIATLQKNVAHGLKKSWATKLKTIGNVWKNDGQRFSKLWAMFFKTMGNVFRRYGQRFLIILTLLISSNLEVITYTYGKHRLIEIFNDVVFQIQTDGELARRIELTTQTNVRT